MVMPNLYGNIIGNICAGLIGGPGLAPGANIGHEVAIFEQGARHVGKDLQGKNAANPTALILSGCTMLHHMGLHECADRIASAVYKTLAAGKVLTADIGGRASTTDFTLALVSNL